MDFFNFISKKKKDKKEKTASYPNATGNSPKSVTRPTQQPYVTPIDPVEQYVKESIANLKQYTTLNTKELEAEAIYLAAFLYMKGSSQINFELDYFSDGLLDKIPSKNFNIADKVFSYMVKYGEGYYGAEERDYGINGYKMNIRMCPNYGSYVKNYFTRAHKIESGKDFNYFKSLRNCLWKNGEKVIDSPTLRDIYYKFNNGAFEIMIPPYNPLIIGHIIKIKQEKIGLIIKQEETTLRCESNDRRRTFIFHFNGGLTPEYLNYIVMYRNDKCDMISYHKD